MTIDEFFNLMTKCGFQISTTPGKPVWNLLTQLDQFVPLTDLEFAYKHIVTEDYLIFFNDQPNPLTTGTFINLMHNGEEKYVSLDDELFKCNIGLSSHSHLFPDKISLKTYVFVYKYTQLPNHPNNDTIYFTIRNAYFGNSIDKDLMIDLTNVFLEGTKTDSEAIIKAYNKVLMLKS